MRIDDLVRLSYRTIKAHTLRSVLTMLGITIGIASVVLLTSIGEGIHRFVLSEFSQFGTNLIAVVPGKTTTLGIPGASISNVRPLSLADAEALKRLDNIISVIPLVQGNARVEYRNRQRRTIVLGVGSAVPMVWKMKVASGKFLPDDDQGAARPYAVLGSKLRDELFGKSNPLGERILIGGNRYRVIGVMAEKGQMLGFDMDDSVYLPAGRTLELFNRESLMEIDLLYEKNVPVNTIRVAIKQSLIARHGREDFTIITQEQMLEVLDSVMTILTITVAALGGISLLVGSVGILTIMTIAVSERIFEIGLLRAMGAERNFILGLFLIEAILLSVMGGVAGVLIGICLVHIIDIAIPNLPVETAWNYAVLSLNLSLIIGILAGVVPAMRAASLNPLEALRAE